MSLKCSKCASYSRADHRCRNGKIQPPTIKGGVEAARIMGISYICVHSPLRAKIEKKLVEFARSIMQDVRSKNPDLF